MELQICGSVMGIILLELSSAHLGDNMQDHITLETYMKINRVWDAAQW